MTDVQTNDTDLDIDTSTEDAQPETPIAMLKKKADLLGIKYKGNISANALSELVNKKLSDPVGESEEEDKPVDKAVAAGTNTKAVSAKASEPQDEYNRAMKLVRVIITPMEATKASNLESELFCAGNSVVGTVKKVIPFGVEWHVEQILLNSIKEKKYQQFISKKNAAGIPITTARLVPAYSISILDPLTEEELKDLADLQLRSRSLDDE